MAKKQTIMSQHSLGFPEVKLAMYDWLKISLEEGNKILATSC